MNISGTVAAVMYRSDEWCSFRVHGEDGRNYNCVGNAYQVERDVNVEIEAEESIHPTHGRQYKIVKYKKVLPTSEYGIQAYLGSGLIKGIGKGLAQNIVQMFGKETFRIICDDPQKLLEVPRLSQKKLESIIAAFPKQELYQNIYEQANGEISLGEAKKIVKAFGKEAIEVLTKDPYQLCKEIDGIGFLKADRIARSCGVEKFSPLRAGAAVVYTLEEIAQQNGDCYMTLDELQYEAVEHIHRLPGDFGNIRKLKKIIYEVAERLEVSFCEAKNSITDKAMLECFEHWRQKSIRGLEDIREIESDKKGVLESSMPTILKDCSEVGIIINAMLEADHAIDWVILKYQLDEDAYKLIVEWIADYGTYTHTLAEALGRCIDVGTIVMDVEKVAAKSLYHAELWVRDNLLHMLELSPFFSETKKIMKFLDSYEVKSGIKMAPEQRDGIIQGILNRISIITGGPGCGKTTIIQVITAWWKLNVSDSIMLVAPTGRAAQRIRESISDNNIEIATVHKMTGGGIRKAMTYPDTQSLIICDESGMIDIFLAGHLLGFARNSTLILVGDEFQLPPVGSGNFFRDLIHSNVVVTTTLVQGFRNKGLVARNAFHIKYGEIKLIQAGRDFRFYFLERELIAEKIVQGYISSINSGERPEEICVLTLQRKRGSASVTALNLLIQKAYNPLQENSPQLAGCQFRIGDRVMQLLNEYTRECSLYGERTLGVFNGDVGTVTDIRPEESALVVTFDDGREVSYDKDELDRLELAYAMTVHKAQGAEYQHVLIAVAFDQYMLLSRSIIYSAVTRSITQLDVYCEKYAFVKAVTTEGSSVRATRLTEYLT